MALTANIKLDNGIEVDNTYCRVETIVCTKTAISFTLRYYASPEKEAYHGVSHTSDYILLEENPFKQAYEYLKTLPEFKSAVDC